VVPANCRDVTTANRIDDAVRFRPAPDEVARAQDVLGVVIVV
jgi:hypothetical protein